MSQTTQTAVTCQRTRITRLKGILAHFLAETRISTPLECEEPSEESQEILSDDYD